MLSALFDKPGGLYVLATLLPLAAAALLMLDGVLFPKRKPNAWGGWFCTLVMLASAALGVSGLVQFLADSKPLSDALDWASLPGIGVFQLGYRIDTLSAVLFAMVSFIAFLIFLFSLGYMKEESHTDVHDHEAHIHRVGRHTRFFIFLSLFTFSMLNLLIADNLFQVFISWELVGVCSFFLIGFYLERPSAARAANKAFIMNRIGDAGFLVALAIAWTYFGTFNFQQIEKQLGPYFTATTLLPERMEKDEEAKLLAKGEAAKLDVRKDGIPLGNDHPTLPYNLFVLMGFGIFLGCAGKSAQVPLQTWLPDAMEGPTPVSALIHAATMVAAGVYLVGRSFSLFAPEVLLTIAYIGAITAFIAATIAVVQTDIKRVLAYSTVSQLGLMMLALGVGSWVGGLMHLVTHAFFKALLFLGSGSVILGCHHAQDLRKMGGLRRKMPVTALTMLIGVLAIAGTPLFAGWYSKEIILGQAYGYGFHQTTHVLLFVIPLVTAGLTAFYMFRMWFLAFAGTPRDEHLHSHVHESPWIMLLPLALLSFFSLAIGWGWPIWEPDQSFLAMLLKDAQPLTAKNNFAEAHEYGHHSHMLVTGLAFAVAFLGAVAAYAMYVRKTAAMLERERNANFVHRFFERKWFFDEIQDAAFRKPTVAIALASARFDKTPSATDDKPRPDSIDGLLNTVGSGTLGMGRMLKGLQSGRLRGYVMTLVLTAGGIFAILSILLG